MRRPLIALFLCCVAVPFPLSAQTAADYISRGIAWKNRGAYDFAIYSQSQALALLNPNDPNDREKISSAYNSRGIAWHEKGAYDLAAHDYNQALATDPNNALAYNNRGANSIVLGEYDKALADYNHARSIDPNYPHAYDNLANVWQCKGEYDKAIAAYNQSRSIDPNDEGPYNGLAWLYATCPDAKYRDGKKAVENASKANRLIGGKNINILITLAAAYAESGDFEKAREWQGKAIELAPERHKAALRSNLELYKQGKPYREELKNK